MMTEILPSVGNHLWQSTIFAICVSALALALGRVPARARFWLWFAAMLKFLIPFSLLLSLGNALAPRHTSGTELQPAPYFQVDAVSQPFTYAPPVLSVATKTAVQGNALLEERIFLVIGLVWVLGFAVVVCSWMVNWRRVRGILRSARHTVDGVEFAILNRLRERMGVKSPVTLMLSDGSMEPGIVGIVRPTLVWPRGISERLDEGQIEAIIAHELAHVERRDNLTAALAMMGSALFWFHPLVPWLKARMLEARERACDEMVILLGNEPEVYAASILRACEFSIESPLACVSGITGSDLKERVRRIMSGNPVRRLSRGAAMVLAGLTVAAVLSPIGFGFLDAPRASAALLQDAGPTPEYSFEVASIKPTKDPGEMQRSLMMSPGRFFTVNIPLRDVIMFAYDAKSSSQISGYPDWVNSTHYDIEAKEDDATAAALNKMSPDERAKQIRHMVQALLVERFQLKVSREIKEIPVYALVVAKGGSKLTEAAPPPPSNDPRGPGKRGPGMGFRARGPGEVEAINATLDAFASMLLSRMPETEGRVVVNKTGLAGKYNFTLKWTPERDAPAAGGQGGPSTPSEEESRPGLLTALEEQLGLKLESQKGSVETLVVDHVEQPSAN